jgi:hypothetical protein
MPPAPEDSDGWRAVLRRLLVFVSAVRLTRLAARRFERGSQMTGFVRLACVVVVLAVGVPAAVGAVAPPRAHPYGETYGQWAGEWTRWAVEMPAAESPFTGTAGCEEHQRGRVFFLPVQFGPGASFDCTVKVGHSLFVSPIGAVCSPATGDGTTLHQLRACARSVLPFVSKVSVRVDGRPVRHARRWRFVSRIVPVALPAGNILGAAAGPTSVITGGWFYLVRPLAPGRHMIRTSATLEAPFGPAIVRFQYRLRVTHS